MIMIKTTMTLESILGNVKSICVLLFLYLQTNKSKVLLNNTINFNMTFKMSPCIVKY